jgi:hypothetical protein
MKLLGPKADIANFEHKAKNTVCSRTYMRFWGIFRCNGLFRGPGFFPIANFEGLKLTDFASFVDSHKNVKWIYYSEHYFSCQRS